MSDSESEDEKSEIKVQGNDVYFYCDVTTETVRDLITTVRKLEIEMATSLIKLGIYDPPKIRIHISTDGGNLYAGISAFDYLRSTRSHVTTIAEGCCASAGTFILLGGDTRLMGKSAYVLIHQLGTQFWGKFEQLKDEVAHCEQLMRTMKRIYTRETTIPEEKLNKLMKRDIYFSHKKCVKYGIVKTFEL